MNAGSQFVQFPLDVLINDCLSAGEKLFLAHLMRWDWGGGCWLTDRQLARELDVSVRSVRNHTKALEEAGHLWVFEDREGMTVRLVVRAGRVYPKPRGLGAPVCRTVSDANKTPARKKSSTSSCAYKDFNYYIKPDFEVHETTTHQQTPVLEADENKDEAGDVVAKNPQEFTEETTGNALESNMVPVGEIPVLDSFSPVIEALQEVGIASPVAKTLASKHSARRIEAAVTYAKGYRGELLNRPGYVVSALQNGWKLPKWCYKPEMPPKRQELPSEARSLPDPTTVPPNWENRRQESLYADLWGQACKIIQSKIQPQSFEMWIQPCFILEVLEGVVTLAAPNRFVAEWAEEHYLWLVQYALKECDNKIHEAVIKVPDTNTKVIQS